MNEATRAALLGLYDMPAPDGGIRAGYDRDHADRTARIVMRMARPLGLDPSRDTDLEVAALLHDIGRAGMDPQLFGRIFRLAEERGLPVRIDALRARFPSVSPGDATPFFIDLLRPALEEAGIAIDARLIDHVRMRMDFDRRLREVLEDKAPDLSRLGVSIKPWMETVILYYYYPGRMAHAEPGVRLMGMALVACENFEAFNNWRRGRDYYGRAKERLRDVFDALSRFEQAGLVSAQVMDALRRLTASRQLDAIIKDARGMAASDTLPEDDLLFLRGLPTAMGGRW